VSEGERRNKWWDISKSRYWNRVRKQSNTGPMNLIVRRCLTGARTGPLHIRSCLFTRTSPRYSFAGTLARTAVSNHPPSGILNFVGSKIWNATHGVGQRPLPFRRDGRPPPPPRKSSPLDRIPRDVIFYGIMAANGVVFLMWQFSASQLVS
jgi:hypothetical protein